MPGKTIRIRSSGGGEFDCYLSLPASGGKVPAAVLASAVHGVDVDVRGIADEFAARGFIAAAPDLFWRSVPGPLPREDSRAAPRSQPRLEKIKAGEADISDVLAEIRKLPQSNGRAMTIGFCYGGPYAILGPARLGYDAGLALHATQMLDYIGELESVTKPVCVIWGDQDQMAPPPVLEAYRALAAKKKNVDLHVFPGILHGYMMPGNAKAYHPATREFSMSRALALFDGLKGG